MLKALIGKTSAISVKYRFILSNCFCVNMTIIPAKGMIVTSIAFHSLTTGIIRIVKFIRNNHSKFISKKNIAYKKIVTGTNANTYKTIITLSLQFTQGARFLLSVSSDQIPDPSVSRR